MNKKTCIFIKKYIPFFAIPLAAFALISAVIHIICAKIPSFAEWIVSNPGYVFRTALAWITNIFPFSLAEMLLILSPIIIVAIIFFAVKKKDSVGRIRFLAGFLSVISLFYSVYVYTLGAGYQRPGLSVRMTLPETEVNAESLHSTLLALRSECEALSDVLMLDAAGSSVMPISFDAMNDEVLIGYERLCNDFPELSIKTFDSRAKQVLSSRAMTSLEILGIYSYFTGESNVNVYYPDYTAPFTAAHELAHQRGIARENEANFIAFAVCIRADDPYVRYSGYMNMFEYVAAALAKTDRELLLSVYEDIDERLLSELRAYSAFCTENKNEFFGAVSNKVNDTYLKSQGTEGIVSYGLVAELCVRYYAE